VNINYKQPQFELFPGSSSQAEDASRPRYLLANLSLSVENLVVLSILGIMVAVFAYSLGVERGKHLMASQVRQTSVASVVSEPHAAVVQQAATTAVTTAVRPAPATTGKANALPAKPTVAVSAAAVVAQKPAVPAAAFKYTIQVASYGDAKFAEKAASDLNKKGFETLVMQKGKYAILCVGKFNQKNEAMSVISKLKSKYKDCLVRSM
jgi:cell division protein FtsN